MDYLFRLWDGVLNRREHNTLAQIYGYGSRTYYNESDEEAEEEERVK